MSFPRGGCFWPLSKLTSKKSWWLEAQKTGLPRCKNLTRFSLFVSYCCAIHYCLKCFVPFILRDPWVSQVLTLRLSPKNLLQLSLKVLFHSSMQTYFAPVDRSHINVLKNLKEISPYSKWVDCDFNSSWNDLDKQPSAKPNVILNFSSATPFKQPSLFVQTSL